MNVQTAMHYLISSCCVRRATWDTGIFTKKTTEKIFPFSDILGQKLRPEIQLTVEDLLADDWEVYRPTHPNFRSFL